MVRKAETALKCTTHQTLAVSPEQALLGRSSLDPLKRRKLIDLESLKERNASIAQENLDKRNKQRKLGKSLQLGDLVLVQNEQRSKLDPLFNGPFKISKLVANPNKVLIENKQTAKWRNIISLKILNKREDQDDMQSLSN